jgi:hypothetical protein
LLVGYLQSPLSNGNGNQTRLSIAVLDGCLKGIGATKFRVCDNQADGPIDRDSQDDEQDDTSEQASLAQGIWLTNDSGTTADTNQTSYGQEWEGGGSELT